MITRTAIATPEQITFCNSPIHIDVENPDIQSAEILLWVWNGALNQPLGDANFRFKKDKVSASDTYVSFEISEYIKSILVAPPNAPNTSQPVFAYNELTNPSITGQAVFWQIQTIAITSTENILTNYQTNVATLGYKFENDQTYFAPTDITAGGSLGFSVIRNKYYHPRIHNYILQSFDLTKNLDECTTANVILTESDFPLTQWLRCSLEPTLIVYLNKVGLFEMFTTHGKVTIGQKMESEKSPRLYRRPNSIDTSIAHSMVKDNFKVTETFNVNTGSLKPEMVEQIEEILISPKVYLIRFKGDIQTTTTTSVTIDNTYITIDSLNTTIDGLSTDINDLGFFKSHIQTPVIVTNSDYTRKTRLNDKKDIDFNLTFEATTNKILDIR
jgi:hypothetical protein